ncbi:MAG: adenylate/guanylate cyclase domain-containing protein [Bacteroidota bacterium]
MIFIKLLFKIRIFFFLIILCNIACQENILASLDLDAHYLITKVPLPSGLGESQILDLEFDKKGSIYISTAGFLWIYNVNRWHKIYTEESLDIAFSDSLGLYVSNGTEIFKLGLNAENKFFLNSLYASSGGNYPVQDIFFFRDHLILKYQDRISCLNLIGHEEKIILDTPEGMHVFLTENQIFLNNSGNTFRITELLKPLTVPEIDFPVSDIIDHPEGYLIIGREKEYPEIYSKDFKAIGIFHILKDRFKNLGMLSQNGMVTLLKDNSILITDKDGYKTGLIENNQLNENEDARIRIAPDNRIWQYNQNFLWLINYPSSIQRISLPFDFPVYDISTLGDCIYLATSEGVIGAQGEKVFNSGRKVFRLFSHFPLLFFLDEKGMGVYHGLNESLKYLFPGEETRLKRFDERFLYSVGDSLFFISGYDFYKNRFSGSVKKKLKENYAYADPLLYHLSDDHIEVFNVKNGDITSVFIPPGLKKEGIQGFFSSGSRLWVHSDVSVYYMDLKDTALNKLDIFLPSFIKIQSVKSLNDQHLLGKIKIEDSPGDFIFIDLESKEVEYFSLPSFPAHYSGYFVEDLDGNRFILGTTDELFLLHKTGKEIHKPFYPEISEMITGGDTLFSGVAHRYVKDKIGEKLLNIPFSNRDLKIAFSSPDFFSRGFVYQYRLNNSSNWSEWREGDYLYLKNLKPGKYDLSLHFWGRNDELSKITRLSFGIKRPLFLSWVAWSIYGMVFCIFMFIVYKKVVSSRLRVRVAREGSPQIKAFHREEPKVPAEENVVARSETAKRRTKWDKYQMVTVLFSDIQGFTRIAEQMNPEKLIDELDRFFFHFDSVVEKYHIEKIKTIGDAYMAAGGIPRKNRSNPVEVVLAALEMQLYMSHLKQTKVDFWDLRIGIHTGPVIAGVVGHKKRSYDIWGDTVNTASRMESSGEAGKVNISGETYQLVREYFICEYRGKLPVKYKGNLDMYFVSGLRPELSVNLEGLPNRKFFLKLQLLRLIDLEDFVFEKLEKETPATYTFHTPDYARQMYNYSELISKAENLDTEETLLIRTAVLFIPLGYLSNYSRPEPEASLLCQKFLSAFHYPEKQIQHISNLILASGYPPEPQTLLEKIMVDIRYEYLGRVDYLKSYKYLYRERNEHLENIEPAQWKEEQVNFLKHFAYFTPGARRLTEISFEKQIERLRNEKWPQ